MSRWLAVLLRLVLAVLALGSVLAQSLLVLAAHQMAAEYPEYAALAVPYTTAAVAAVVCGQVALGIVWHLVGMVTADAIFTLSAVRWVTALTWCAGAATVLVVAVTGHVVGVLRDGGAALTYGLLGASALGVAATLLLVVMRHLLRAATAARSELDEVI